jgi:MoxR-like ATPase
VGAHAVDLLEREDELRLLTQRLDDALDGAGSLVVVEGPAGIGKTTLLRATAELAEQRGMTVLRARGGVLELHLEYGVVRQQRPTRRRRRACWPARRRRPRRCSGLPRRRPMQGPATTPRRASCTASTG